MSIEREAFEQLEDIAAMITENPGIEFENGKYVYYGLDGRTAFAAVYISGAWSGWQAKAQAVPEGFILMPKDPTKDTLIEIASVCIGDDFANLDEANKLYKAAIKAQEPK